MTYTQGTESIENREVRQFLLTPAAGKRMIARAMLQIPTIRQAIYNKTVVVVAGTTNGYVAEEILKSIGQEDGFKRNRFIRGVTLPPKYVVTDQGRVEDESGFPGDVVIENGVWKKKKTIFDVVDELRPGDIIIKGANAVDLTRRQAAILIGHPKGGTVLAAIQANIGKRAELYLPVGLEKRITGDLNQIAQMLNSSNAQGCRYMPIVGHIVTELEAINIISGASAKLVAAGGVCGAEGSCWIAVSGTADEVTKAKEVIEQIQAEPAFTL